MEFLSKWYKPVSFEDLDHMLTEGKVPFNTLIVTFDDGYEDNFTIGFPILKRMGIKATLFLTVGAIGKDRKSRFWWDIAYNVLLELSTRSDQEKGSNLNREERELIAWFRRDYPGLFSDLNRRDTRAVDDMFRRICERHCVSHDAFGGDCRILAWEQVRAMMPLVEVGAHGVNHLNLTFLNKDEVRRELQMSKEIIEKQTGARVLAISYPAGEFTPLVKSLSEEVGYCFGLGTREGVNDVRDRYELRRIHIWQGSSEGEAGEFSPSMFALLLSGLFAGRRC